MASCLTLDGGQRAHAVRDRIDAVRAVVKAGLVDLKRIALVGSYLGARVALGAIGDEPALFKCAVLINGAYDQDSYVNYLSGIAPAVHRAVQAQIKILPAAAESFRGLKPIAALTELKLATLITDDAPINDVTKIHTWATWTDRGSRIISRDFKKAGASSVLKPISDEHGEAFDRQVTMMAGVDDFLKEKLLPRSALGTPISSRPCGRVRQGGRRR